MSILETLGQDPQRSMRRFILGLGFFILGVIAVFVGRYHDHLWQIFGLLFITIGCFIAIYGYIGIFANRLYHAFNRK